MKRLLGAAVASACVALTVGTGATAAFAGQSQQTVMCNGQPLVIRTNNNNSSDKGGWSSVQVLSGGSGHLTPTSFSGMLVDNKLSQVLFQFSSAKGNGNANHNQQQSTCTQVITGMTLADFFEPGGQLPPGASLTDSVTFTFTATVVQNP